MVDMSLPGNFYARVDEIILLGFCFRDVCRIRRGC